MTAVFRNVEPGTKLRVLPSAPECLAAGEELVVYEDGKDACVHCRAGNHYLNQQADGTLKDFECVGVTADA